MKKTIAIYILIMCCSVMMAQTDRQHIRMGNRQYRDGKVDKAEVEYRKAADKNSKNPQALYNLGCALMQQQKDSAAVVQFEAAGKLETSKARKAMIYHNIGVICQQHQMFGEAIEAYKESLRNNPKDDETRYNLALCKRQQKNQQNQQNQDNKNQDKDKNGQDQKKDQNQQDDKNQQKQDKQQPPKEQMSKENAEQLLQAAMQEEKNTQKKMKQHQGGKRQLEKNW